MARVALVHWKAEEQAARLRWFDEAGHEAIRLPVEETPILRALREDPPDVLVISLERSPSGGREVARRARLSPRSSQVALVFVGGAPEKVAPLLEMFPDACFSDDWEGAVGAVEEALALDPACFDKPGEKPEVPLSVRLGVEPGVRVYVRGGALAGIAGVDRLDGAGLAAVFVRSMGELEALFAEVGGSGGSSSR